MRRAEPEFKRGRREIGREQILQLTEGGGS